MTVCREQPYIDNTWVKLVTGIDRFSGMFEKCQKWQRRSKASRREEHDCGSSTQQISSLSKLSPQLHQAGEEQAFLSVQLAHIDIHTISTHTAGLRHKYQVNISTVSTTLGYMIQATTTEQ